MSLGSANLAGYLLIGIPSVSAWLLADATINTPSLSSLSRRLPLGRANRQHNPSKRDTKSLLTELNKVRLSLDAFQPRETHI